MSSAGPFHALSIPNETRRPSPPQLTLEETDFETLSYFDSVQGILPIEIRLQRPSVTSVRRRHSSDSLKNRAKVFSLLKPNAFLKGLKGSPAIVRPTKTSVWVLPTRPIVEDADDGHAGLEDDVDRSEESAGIWLAGTKSKSRDLKIKGSLVGEEVISGPTNSPTSTHIPPSPASQISSPSIHETIVGNGMTNVDNVSTTSSDHSCTASFLKQTSQHVDGCYLGRRRRARRLCVTAAGLSLVPQDSLDIAHQRYQRDSRTRSWLRELSRSSDDTLAPREALASNRSTYGIVVEAHAKGERAASDRTVTDKRVHIRIEEDRNDVAPLFEQIDDFQDRDR